MNSTINKTFYTCSTESLFLRYKKISKKAVKLGSFLQCSVHIFLGHDGCFKNCSKNFMKPYHEELPIKAWSMWQHHIFPKTFPFEGSKQLIDLCYVDSRIIYFWYVLERIDKFIIELHVLQCFFVIVGQKKSKWGVALFQISEMKKEGLLMTTKLLLGVISQCGFQDKVLLLPFSLAQKRIYLNTLNWR